MSRFKGDSRVWLCRQVRLSGAPLWAGFVRDKCRGRFLGRFIVEKWGQNSDFLGISG
jgi:hypothetical protein